jgi:hypothetical protein
VIQVGAKSYRFWRNDLIRVDIDAKPDRMKPALVGILMGIYAGSALFMRAEGQTGLFFGRDNDEFWGVILPEAAFALVGGGVGFIAGASLKQHIVFDFSGGEEENASRWEELCEAGSDGHRSSTLHFSIQSSWVSGPLPYGENYSPGYFSNSQATRLNLLRRMQMTYSITDFIDVGFAVMWLGQPSFDQHVFSPQSAFYSLNMSGRGLYVVGVFQPLWKLAWPDVQWDVGVGVGTAAVNFNAESLHYVYSPFYGYETEVRRSTGYKESTFSVTINTELKVFIADYFSLGLSADLVYIPDDVPDIPGINLESKTLGTSSIGLVLGIHI